MSRQLLMKKVAVAALLASANLEIACTKNLESSPQAQVLGAASGVPGKTENNLTEVAGTGLRITGTDAAPTGGSGLEITGGRGPAIQARRRTVRRRGVLRSTWASRPARVCRWPTSTVIRRS